MNILEQFMINENLSKIIIKNLNEKYGIKDVNNKKYHIQCKELSKQIYNKLKTYLTSKTNNYEIILKNNNIEFYCNEIYFTFKNIDWLNNVRILVGDGLYNENNNFYCNDNSEICLITDTAIYNIDNNFNIIKEKMSYHIIKETNTGNKTIIPFIINNKLDTITILFNIIKDDIQNYSIDKIISILKHEIGHAYDLFIQNKTTDQLNNDIIFNDFLNYLTKNNNIYTQTNYNNFLISDIKNKKYILKNIFSENDILNFICKNNELMNISDLHQYLYNFKYDIDKLKSKKFETLYYSKLNNNNDFLINISSIYKERYSLYINLKLIKQYIPNKIKNIFSEKFIKQFYLNQKIFNKELKNNTDNLILFDKFIDLFINRIYNIFIKNCYKILYDKLQRTNLYRSKLILNKQKLIGLQKQKL